MHMKNLFLRLTMIAALVATSVTAFAQSTVKGSVKDVAGEAIIGASVLVQGTHNGVVTDLDGNFSLGGVRWKAPWSPPSVSARMRRRWVTP